MDCENCIQIIKDWNKGFPLSELTAHLGDCLVCGAEFNEYFKEENNG